MSVNNNFIIINYQFGVVGHSSDRCYYYLGLPLLFIFKSDDVLLSKSEYLGNKAENENDLVKFAVGFSRYTSHYTLLHSRESVWSTE